MAFHEEAVPPLTGPRPERNEADAFPGAELPEPVLGVKGWRGDVLGAGEPADGWHRAYLLVLINLFHEGVSIEHRRQAFRRDELTVGLT